MMTLNVLKEDRTVREEHIDWLGNSQAGAVCRLKELKEVCIVTDETADEEAFWIAPKSVRFTSSDGRSVDICYLNAGIDSRKEGDELALNKVLNHFNLLPGGKIIGINWTIEEAFDYVWSQIPTEKKHITLWPVGSWDQWVMEKRYSDTMQPCSFRVSHARA